MLQPGAWSCGHMLHKEFTLLKSFSIFPFRQRVRQKRNGLQKLPVSPIAEWRDCKQRYFKRVNSCSSEHQDKCDPDSSKKSLAKEILSTEITCFSLAVGQMEGKEISRDSCKLAPQSLRSLSVFRKATAHFLANLLSLISAPQGGGKT